MCDVTSFVHNSVLVYALHTNGGIGVGDEQDIAEGKFTSIAPRTFARKCDESSRRRARLDLRRRRTRENQPHFNRSQSCPCARSPDAATRLFSHLRDAQFGARAVQSGIASAAPARHLEPALITYATKQVQAHCCRTINGVPQGRDNWESVSWAGAWVRVLVYTLCVALEDRQPRCSIVYLWGPVHDLQLSL